MRKMRALNLALLLLPLTVHAALPDHGNTVTFLGPTMRLGLVQSMSLNSAYALQGEFGTSNLRFDGTLGFLLTESQRLKLSAEFLTQNLTYGFSSGDTTQWRPQGSIGASYACEMGRYSFEFNPVLTLNAYASHTPTKSLRNNLGSYTNSSGTPIAFINTTRIAGSSAYGFSPGFYLRPWIDGTAGIEVNYDNVAYRDSYLPSDDPKGFGATIHYKQMISPTISMDFAAGQRQPFNLYQARVEWLQIPFFGLWGVGFGGEYTIGKNRLPSSYNLGVSLDYYLDRQCHGSYSERDEMLSFMNDTTYSAARLPEVLAARDELFVTL